MSPDARRKYERNQREKQRSFKISKQIKDLQEVLTSLQIPYKNDKFSVLMSAVDFISEVREVVRSERRQPVTPLLAKYTILGHEATSYSAPRSAISTTNTLAARSLTARRRFRGRTPTQSCTTRR